MSMKVDKRPSSAPNPSYAPLQSDDEIINRCSVCFRKIFAGAFAEISGISSNEAKKLICSAQCFSKYIGANKFPPDADKKKLKHYKPHVPPSPAGSVADKFNIQKIRKG